MRGWLGLALALSLLVGPWAVASSPPDRVSGFARAAREYCRQLRCSVTSWGRTEWRNRLVGGVAGSAHLRWLAVDVVYDPPRPALSRRRSVASRLGLVVIPERTHDHVQMAGVGDA